MKKKVTTEQSNGIEAPVTKPDLPKVPTLTGTELKRAFAAYDTANERVEKAKAELEKAMAARSNAVKQIAEGAGKGPFSYNGVQLTPVCRTMKESGAQTWYFKGPSSDDLIKV